MERRSALRIEEKSPVKITVLSGAGRSFAGRLQDISSGGARVALPEKLAPGTLIRIDLEDALLLGEICHVAEME